MKSVVKTKAFSVIELLIVVAVIAILAAILVPAIGRVRERANATKCASNLRQIAIAANMYAAENNGDFPSLTGEADDGGGQVTWLEQLRPYIHVEGSNEAIELINCPAAEHYLEVDGNSKTTHAYGWNPRLIPDTRTKADGSKRLPFKSIKVQRPSETILMADAGQRYPSGWGFGYFAFGGVYNPSSAETALTDADFTRYGASASNPSFSTRHGGVGNAVFVDGHVQSFAWGEIKQKHVYTED